MKIYGRTFMFCSNLSMAFNMLLVERGRGAGATVHLSIEPRFFIYQIFVNVVDHF